MYNLRLCIYLDRTLRCKRLKEINPRGVTSSNNTQTQYDNFIKDMEHLITPVPYESKDTSTLDTETKEVLEEKKNYTRTKEQKSQVERYRK